VGRLESRIGMAARLGQLLRGRTAQNLLALYGVQFANYLLPLIMLPYLARVLSVDGYGLVAFATSFAGIFNVILDYGFNLTATRDIAVVKEDRAKVAQIVSEVVFTKATMLLLALAVFGTLVTLTPSLNAHSAVMWLAFLGILGNTFLPTWLFQGFEKLPQLATVNLIFRSTQIPLMFLFVKSKDDVLVWLFIVAMTTIFATALAWVQAICRYHLRISWPRTHAIRRQLEVGFPVFLSQAAVTLFTTANTFILGTLTNLTVAGYFSAAERLVRSVFGLLAPINQVLFPRASALASQSESAALTIIRKSLLLVGVLGLVLSLGLFLLSSSAVLLLLGREFIPAVQVVEVMSTLPLLFALGAGLTLLVLLPFKLENQLLVVYTTSGIINLVLAFFLVPKWGAVGMATAVVAAEMSVVINQARIALTRGINLFARER